MQALPSSCADDDIVVTNDNNLLLPDDDIRCHYNSEHDVEFNDRNSMTTIPQQQLQPWDYAYHGKLYCRRKEKETILSSYNTIKNRAKNGSKTKIILIHGETGVGKTTLARSIRSTVTLKDSGYYMSGKFDDYKQNLSEPYSAILAALTEFSELVIGRGRAEIEHVRKQVEMYNIIKSEQRILTDMIPLLHQILDSDSASVIAPETARTNNPTTRTTDGSIAMYNNNNDNNNNGNVFGIDTTTNRFKYVFSMFMKAISSNNKEKKQPVVFVIDDIHWADEASLDLLTNMLLDPSINEGILYIGTYRDDIEYAPASSCSDRFRRFLTTIQQHNHDQNINLHDIALQNFQMDEVENMLTETIILESVQSLKSLTNLLHIQTKGNIFFVLELLRSMFSRGILVFDVQDKKWKFTIIDDSLLIEHPKNAISLHDFVTLRMRQQVPEICQKLLQYGAFLGTKFDELILEKLMSVPVAPYLHSIQVYFGWVVFNNNKNNKASDNNNKIWKFTHDCIQEAIYNNTISNPDRYTFHYQIGRKLWRALSLDELDRFIFVVVGQLLFGIEAMTNQDERTAVAKLCHRAGERSVQLSNFRSAFEYLSKGITLLCPQSWRYEYDLCLSLYNAAAEVAYCNADFESVFQLVDEILRNVHQFEHTIQAHSTKLYSLGTCGRLNEAIDSGLSILKALGETFPRRPSRLLLIPLLFNFKRKLRGKTDQDLLNLPLMNDPKKLCAMKIINTIFLYVSMAREDLAPFLGFRLLGLTLDYGLSTISPLGFIFYGISLCSFQIDEGYRFGRLGLQIYEMFGINHWIGRVFLGYFGVIHGLRMPVQECIDALKYAHLVALEKGDIEYAFYNASRCLWFQLQKESLTEMNKCIQAINQQLTMFGQDQSLIILKPMTLTLQNMMGTDDSNPCDNFIIDSDYDSIKSEIDMVVGYIQFHKMWSYYMLGHWENAYVNSKLLFFGYARNPLNIIDLPFLLLFVGLVELEWSRQSNRNRCRAIFFVRKCIRKVKTFAVNAPANALGKQFLLEAELAAVRNQNSLAFAKYTGAIAVSKNSNFIIETALSNEHTAKFLMNNTREKERAKSYFLEALYYYREWGSRRKEALLKNEITEIYGENWT